MAAIWVFKTREGGVGLLRILEGTENPLSITLEYKLMRTRANSFAVKLMPEGL
jgi:hypothetical protein